MHNGDTVEVHPAALSAAAYLQSLGQMKLLEYKQALSLFGGQGDAVGLKLSETMAKLIELSPVSDRDLLALAWVIRDMELSA